MAASVGCVRLANEIGGLPMNDSNACSHWSRLLRDRSILLSDGSIILSEGSISLREISNY